MLGSRPKRPGIAGMDLFKGRGGEASTVEPSALVEVTRGASTRFQGWRRP